MENREKYLEDLHEIRKIMHQSSRFISLSGISGILAGIYALIGAWLAYQTIYEGQDYLAYRKANLTTQNLIALFSIALAVIVLSILSGIYFTTRKARKENQKLWDIQSKRLIVNMLIPLATGGILCLIFIAKGFIGIVAPLTLIFYGLALVNASKYTLNEIRGLGLIEIVLGLMAAYFIGYGLLFWAIGFGLLHIVYGIFMHLRHGT